MVDDQACGAGRLAMLDCRPRIVAARSRGGHDADCIGNVSDLTRHVDIVGPDEKVDLGSHLAQMASQHGATPQVAQSTADGCIKSNDNRADHVQASQVRRLKPTAEGSPSRRSDTALLTSA